MKTYGQYCPVSRAAEIFAERWTPIIIRNLHLGERTFGGIKAGAPGISGTLLSKRLRALERDGIVRTASNPRGRGSVYELTEAGEELWDVCDALGVWGARWLDIAPQHMDPYVVLWATCKTLEWGRIPDRRVNIRFDIRDGSVRKLWLLLEKPHAEVCVKPPGFDEDLIVSTTREGLTLWHTGVLTYRQALASGLLRVDGPPRLVRALGTWGGLSRYAAVRPAS